MMPAGLAAMASSQLPFLLIAALYGWEATGQYAVAETVVGIPVVVIAASVAQVYLAEGARTRHSSPELLKPVFMTTLKRLVLVGLPLECAISVLAPKVIPLLLGDNWELAGRMARVMAFYYFGAFLYQPMSQTLVVLERQKTQMACDFALLVIGGASLIGSSLLGLEPLGAVTIFSLSMGTFSLLYLIVPYSAVKRFVPPGETVDNSAARTIR